MSIAGTPARLVDADGPVVPVSWSPDGRFLLYEYAPRDRGVELRIASIATGETTRYLDASAKPRQARFSPDGHWVAYTSDISGQSEIYVDAFPGAGRRRQVSTDGGRQPVWQSSGRDLYYIAARTIVAVPVRMDAATFETGAPFDLFEVPRGEVFDSRAYALSDDGQRVLLNLETNRSAQINAMTATVVTNWARKLTEATHGEETVERLPTRTGVGHRPDAPVLERSDTRAAERR
jgi:dipeptidyl aminopeptidase/acylaminoacyl peptidase